MSKEKIQDDNATTGSGYSEEERNREDGTNQPELDDNYYDDKENPKRKKDQTDYNRSETPE